MKRRQLGFTLVEAMVGVTILTVLTLAMAGTFLVGGALTVAFLVWRSTMRPG